MTTPASTPAVATASAEDKTSAIVCYLTLIGFIVAVILHGSKKTRLGAFHLRQALGIMLTSIALGVCAVLFAVIPIIGWLAACVLWLSLFVLWVLGLIGALNGEMKPVPVLGESYQKWFGSAFD